jgi:hypothetical protein
VPTLSFGVLYCFFIIGHDRRKILRCHVTRHPTALWPSMCATTTRIGRIWGWPRTRRQGGPSRFVRPLQARFSLGHGSVACTIVTRQRRRQRTFHNFHPASHLLIICLSSAECALLSDPSQRRNFSHSVNLCRD